MKPIIVFNYTLHKEMWNWIANNPKYSKEEWINIKGKNYLNLKEKRIMYSSHYCFACAACGKAILNNVNVNCLEVCPLNWNRECACYDEGGLYYIYCNLYDEFMHKKCIVDEILNKISSVAKQIADLPVRQQDGYELIVI